MNEISDFTKCKICKIIPDYKSVEKLHTDERLPKEVKELQIIGGYPINCQVRKCTLCGTYYNYYYDHDSQSGVGEGYTDESIERITPKKAQELIKHILKVFPDFPSDLLEPELVVKSE